MKMEDAILLRYSQLEDISKIQVNIEQVFKGFPALQVLVDDVSKMVDVMNTIETLTETLHWQQQRILKRKCMAWNFTTR